MGRLELDRYAFPSTELGVKLFDDTQRLNAGQILEQYLLHRCAINS